MKFKMTLEHTTGNIEAFKKTSTYSSYKWEENIGDITFEDKVLLEKSIRDFKEGKTVSHDEILKLLRN